MKVNIMYVGGLRARLIKDNFFNYIHDCLDNLNWLDENRQHLPVTVRATPVEDNEEINRNIVSVVEEDLFSVPQELGSKFNEHIWTFFIDIYAESHAVGLHLATDIRDILQGRMPSVGAITDNFTVYDLSQSTPTELFKCEIEDVTMDRNRSYTKPFRKYWWIIGCNVLDYYGDEDDV